MALSQKLIQFFYDGINNASTKSIKGITSQLFEHLSTEVKDNPIYNKYISELISWENWPEEHENSSFSADWQMPGNFESAKSLAFAIYKRLSLTSDLESLLYHITSEGNLKASIHVFNGIFLSHLGKVLEDILNANPELAPDETEKVKGTRVFIIHGHDELLKKDLQLLLARAGVNSIVLHEQPDQGRSIIDKLIEESADSNYAIALLTPDDINKDGLKRARQNVIFEAGYFLGLLGKKRMRLLVKGEIEIPSDLHGILYEKHDTGGGWKTKILKELQAVGIYVDFAEVMKTL